MFVYVTPHSKPTHSKQDFVFEEKDNNTVDSCKQFVNKHSNHPNQNHPLYEDEFEEEYEKKAVVKESQPLLPHSKYNPSCYTFTQDDKVYMLDKTPLLRDIKFDRYRGINLYGQELTDEQIQHANNLLRVYQAIADNDQIAHEEWCLVIRDGLEVCSNFSKRIKGFEKLNIVGNFIVLSDNKINNFDNANVTGHTSKYRFHRYKEETDCYFFSRGYDTNLSTSIFLIRKSLAKRIIQASKKDGYFFLAGDIDMLDKIHFFPVYIRGVFAIDPHPVPTLELKPEYYGFSRIINNCSMWINAYYRQLRITSNLDTPMNQKHGF